MAVVNYGDQCRAHLIVYKQYSIQSALKNSETNVEIPATSPTYEGGQIHLNTVATTSPP